MAERQEVKKVEVFKKTEMKPKQSLLNLDTNSEQDVEIKYNIFSVNDPPDNVKPEDWEKTVLVELHKMVKPQSEMIRALIEFVNRREYQNGKTKAMESGNFVTQALRSSIVGILKSTAKFADSSAKETYEAWLEGYKKKAAGAIKVLQLAKATTQEDELTAGF